MAHSATLSQNESIAALCSEGFYIFKLLGYKEDEFTTIHENLVSHYDGKLTFKLPEGGAQNFSYSKANSGVSLLLTSIGVKPVEGINLGDLDLGIGREHKLNS